MFQKVAQVASSEFGLDLDRIKITATDTAKVPNTSATAASSGSDLNGMAVKLACEDIRRRMANFLGGYYQVGASEVLFAGNDVRIGGHVLSFAQAAKICY